MSDKPHLLEGDILLVHSRGFSPISFGIRLLTKSFWNHTGMYVEDTDGKGYIIEALFRGVVKTPIKKYLNNPKYKLKIVKLKSSSFKNEIEWLEGIKTAVRRIKASVGFKYDKWALVWLGVKYIARGVWNKGAKYLPENWNPFQSRYRFFCSELVATAWYKTSSISKYPNLFAGKKYQDVSLTTPGDIAKSENVSFVSEININRNYV